MFRSDDEFEDGTQILPFYWDSRKVVNVSRSRVGSGAPRGARPLPWLGCLACKHLTWIFRSLVSPASAPPAEWSPAAGSELSTITFLSWAPGPVWRLPVARLCLSRLGSLSVSFSENFTRSVDWAGNWELVPGPSRVSPGDQDQDWSSGLSHRWPVLLTSHCDPLLSSDPHFAGLHYTP